MKPLTIEQLKSLEVGDWVYIKALTINISPEFDLSESEFYYRVCKRQDNTFFEVVGGEINVRHYLCWKDYGTKWLAYKNKEMAECKGEIVELPCLRDVKNAIVGKQKQLLYAGVLGYVSSTIYNDDEFAEAERRLAELRGEK